MKELTLLLLIRLIAYVYSGAFYQILPNYSFNFKNQKTSSVISSFILQGDAVKDKDSFKLTSNQANSYGSFITSKPLNVSRFEYQITFQMNAKHTRGSAIGIWFYSEKTDMENGKTFFGFTNQFKGFGILIYTKPEIKEDLTTLHYRIILNEKGTVLDPIDLNQLEKDLSCTELMSKRSIKVTIKTAEEYLQVMFDNVNSLINNCCHSFTNYVNKKKYNIAVTSFNGEYNNTLFQDQVEVTKVAMFNTHYKDSRAILGLPDLPVKEYDYQLHQPLKKEDEAKSNKPLTLNDLNMAINKCSVDSLKIKEQMTKGLNITFLNQTIPFLANNINYLIEIFNATYPLIISNEEQELFSQKIVILSKEYTQLVNRWNTITVNATITDYPSFNLIQKALVQMHHDIVELQNLDFYEGDRIMIDISQLKRVLTSQETTTTPNHIVYVIVVVLVIVIGILIFLIFRKTKKEKDD